MENVPPQWARGLAREVRALLAAPPPGIAITDHHDLSDIRATIDGPADTPYEGGAFLVRVCVGREYPAAPPRVRFLTRIFHPNVSASGEVCVDTLTRAWRPDLGLQHVLLTIKCLLMQPNPESALNAEAGDLLRDHREHYLRRAALYTQIHARPLAPPSTSTSTSTSDPSTSPAQSTAAPTAPPALPTSAKRRRRVLKRL